MSTPSEVAKYRKLPVEIEAAQLSQETALTLANWCGGTLSMVADEAGKVTINFIEITTPEGVMQGVSGDWIVRGVKGEFYPVKPHIFEASYKLADPKGESPE